MKKDIKDKWLTALRSGEYQQAEKVLRSEDDNGRASYCCLGVLCELAMEDGVPVKWHPEVPILMALTQSQMEEENLSETDALGDQSIKQARGELVFEYDSEDLPPLVREWAGLAQSNPVIDGVPLSIYNDGSDEMGRSDFDEIADLIEEHIPGEEVTS